MKRNEKLLAGKIAECYFDALHDLLSEFLMFKHKCLMMESEMNA